MSVYHTSIWKTGSWEQGTQSTNSQYGVSRLIVISSKQHFFINHTHAYISFRAKEYSHSRLGIAIPGSRIPGSRDPGPFCNPEIPGL